MLPYGRKTPLPFPLFRSGHMSAICARLGSKGKVGVQRGRETAGVPSFLPPRRVPHSRGGCRTPPPSADGESPRRGRGSLPRSAERNFPLNVSKKLSARKRTNTLTQFAYPSHPVPRMPDRSAVLGKSKNPIPTGTGFCTSLYMCSGISPER